MKNKKQMRWKQGKKRYGKHKQRVQPSNSCFQLSLVNARHEWKWDNYFIVFAVLATQI